MTETVVFRLRNAAQHVGSCLGVSAWVSLDQTQVNIFGEVTRWRTPGHCDPAAAKHSRYGGTLLHGFHGLALLPYFYQSAGCWPEDGEDPLNYGLNKVRMLQPIIIGEGVRLRSEMHLLAADAKRHGDYLLTVGHEIEAEGTPGTAIYAEYLTYWHAKNPAL
jgi:acyl dehydratase